LTAYTDIDTAIGQAGTDSYSPLYGSDGSTTPYIRAGTNTNGVGFIEFATYVQVPSGSAFATYSLAIGVNYDWIT
jgi:hypothetical protein